MPAKRSPGKLPVPGHHPPASVKSTPPPLSTSCFPPEHFHHCPLFIGDQRGPKTPISQSINHPSTHQPQIQSIKMDRDQAMSENLMGESSLPQPPHEIRQTPSRSTPITPILPQPNPHPPSPLPNNKGLTPFPPPHRPQRQTHSRLPHRLPRNRLHRRRQGRLDRLGRPSRRQHHGHRNPRQRTRTSSPPHPLTPPPPLPY